MGRENVNEINFAEVPRLERLRHLYIEGKIALPLSPSNTNKFPLSEKRFFAAVDVPVSKPAAKSVFTGGYNLNVR